MSLPRPSLLSQIRHHTSVSPINLTKGFKPILDEPYGTNALHAWKTATENGTDIIRICTRDPVFTRPILQLGKDSKPQASPVRTSYACTGG